MRVAIGSIIELVRPEPATFLREATRDVVVIARILIWFFRHRLRTSAPSVRSRSHFFRRLVFGNDNDRTVAPRLPDDREANPGVTSRSLNDRGAWLKTTRFLGVLNDSVSGRDPSPIRRDS